MTRRQRQQFNASSAPRAVAIARDKQVANRRRVMMVAGTLLALLALLVIAAPRAHAADTRVSVWVNGCPKDFQPAAVQRNGITYVPLRQGVEAVGARMKWDRVANKAIITSGGRTAIVRKSDGILVNGALLIPLRLVSQALDCRVAWDPGAKAVRLTLRQAMPTVPT